MKPQLLTILICGLLLALAQPSWARKWTDNTGKFSVEAEFVAVNDGKAVLRKTTGKTIAVPVNRLSVADRKYIGSLEKPSQQAAVESNRAEQEAAYAIARLGGSVRVDQQRPGKPVVMVNFNGTRVTDAGLEHLKGLTSLRKLYLPCTQITDGGLEHLKGLTSLRLLDLGNTKVTDEGIKKLRQALWNCKIRH